jgi:hypothetical protein
MTSEDYAGIAQVIKANRFFLKSEGIRALAEHFESRDPTFNRKDWFALIEPWRKKP